MMLESQVRTGYSGPHQRVTPGKVQPPGGTKLSVMHPGNSLDPRGSGASKLPWRTVHGTSASSVCVCRDGKSRCSPKRGEWSAEA